MGSENSRARLCQACSSELPDGARVCLQCGSWQSRFGPLKSNPRQTILANLLALLLLAGLLGGLLYLLRGDRGNAFSRHSLTVSDTSHHVLSGSHPQVVLLGKLSNTADVDLYCPEVVAEFYDSEGTLIDVLHGGQVPRTVPAGAVVAFKLQGPAAADLSSYSDATAAVVNASRCARRR